jgi:hypothetical protein
MNDHVELFKEPVEKGTLEVLLSVREEDKLLAEQRDRAEIAQDLLDVMRELVIAGALFAVLAGGTHYWFVDSSRPQAESSFFSMSTLRNVFSVVGGVGWVLTAVLGAAAVHNKHQIRKNSEKLKPYVIT